MIFLYSALDVLVYLSSSDPPLMLNLRLRTIENFVFSFYSSVKTLMSVRILIISHVLPMRNAMTLMEATIAHVGVAMKTEMATVMILVINN